MPDVGDMRGLTCPEGVRVRGGVRFGVVANRGSPSAAARSVGSTRRGCYYGYGAHGYRYSSSSRFYI